MATRNRNRSAGFTLVELLVVIGIIAILISILLPSLNKAREQATSLKCQSNLRQVSMAAIMYANAHKGVLPYPTTGLGESMLWFNGIDPYLGAKYDRSGATGVAAGRAYKAYKQCPIYDSFDGDQFQGGQNQTKEYARTFKMNNHLRRNGTRSNILVVNPANEATGVKTAYTPNFVSARLTDVRQSAQFVFFGDGLSLDFTGPVANQAQSGEFSMEVDLLSEASPGLRHRGGANIAFVDGHVEWIKQPTISKMLTTPAVPVQTWESEFVNAAGQPVNPDGRKSIESQNLRRNGRSPLIWGVPGKLYGRNS
jgi:prepilin-type processing-associated H-X9-DG protein/prepilin-type N-terminal cleavage/methylation domain-containing protein